MTDTAYNAGLVSAASGAMSRLRAIDIITNNLANTNTPGFRRDVPGFDAALVRAQQGGDLVTTARLQRVSRDNTPGELKKSGNPLDVAIIGRGYFRVQDPKTGGEFYTRQGNFSRSPDGVLLTGAGYPVLGEGGPITLPAGGRIEIDPDGTILRDGQQVGRLQLVDFPDDVTLTRKGRGLLAAPQGTSPLPMDNPKLLQGWIETANVSPLTEMTRMVSYERDFEAYQKLIKAYGQLATKAAEIGAF
ncbi:flagellar basal-body rod protein FlgG [Geothermobacter ehrlichii]|uniref:Flagellar basal-body rod protein FlgG n=1 Tax=Geothermobacter ehrlichii TaxID=213224 RepID=A0A5D3WNQ4_9BACT|nr:flagellar basal-body rod protein FlgF [Geothermobacter ehrlichii]TYP00188.1 flagellar basal-body rod protein FlgG [Geothermobacter ehrlichii]